MYNKIFTKILDSSIWLESTPTRIVWLTFIAVMDEKGFAPFAAMGNVANRARVSIEEARAAIDILEGPDPESSDPDNDGRRLERVPGGWIVLNAEKHRDLVTRAVRQAQTAERVRRHREKKRTGNARVTPSEALSVSVTEEKKTEKSASSASLSPAAPLNHTKHEDVKRDPFTDPAVTERAGRFVDRYGALYAQKRNGARYAAKPTRDYAAAVTLCQTWTDDERLDKLAICFLTTDNKFAEEGSRTIPQFLALASWCDGKLAEWEKGRANRGRN